MDKKDKKEIGFWSSVIGIVAGVVGLIINETPDDDKRRS